MEEFIKWPKTERLKHDLTITVTEKIDGTNAQIHILDDFETMLCGSRTRYITPETDNAGFARWCEKNKAELLELGPGRHYGEWYGSGIQRKYGLDHKRFALFNVGRWKNFGDNGKYQSYPECCEVVPTLYVGKYQGHDHLVGLFEEMKNTVGSHAVNGWNKPEGIWIYFHEARHSMKMPFDKDARDK